jgi:Ca2+-binding EF-hand superfamily protein
MEYNPEDYANDSNLNKEIFELFDLDGSGKIDVNDLEEIGRAMGWKKQEGNFIIHKLFSLVNELILSLDPNNDGQITWAEFQVVMKHIEDRLQTSNNSSVLNGGSSRISQS